MTGQFTLFEYVAIDLDQDIIRDFQGVTYFKFIHTSKNL